jgi:hypothetical protein
VVTGLQTRFLPIRQLRPASSWGHQGVDREDQTPGLLRALPTTGLIPRGGQHRPRCRVSIPLPAERVPSARRRTGGRHCLYRLESVAAPSLHRYRERSPEALPPRAGSSSSRILPSLVLSRTCWIACSHCSLGSRSRSRSDLPQVGRTSSALLICTPYVGVGISTLTETALFQRRPSCGWSRSRFTLFWRQCDRR